MFEVWSGQASLVVLHTEACDTEISQIRGAQGQTEGSDLNQDVLDLTTCERPVSLIWTSTLRREPELD